MKIELSVSTLAALAPGPRLSTTAARFNSTAPQRTSGLLRLWRAALLGFALAVLPGLANAQEIYWRLHGNTNEGGDNFLGIANSGSLDFRVNGFRALRLEFGGTSPNVIGGSLGNFVSSGEGNAIGGGGTYVNNLDTNSLADLTNKIINANFGTIGGGIGNTVSAHHGTVAGGQLNTSSGDAASVGGGEVCAASGTVSTVSGGFENTSSGYAASVGGGANNTASASYTTVGGGFQNVVNIRYGIVAGGFGNTVSGDWGTVSGGEDNTASGEDAAVGGGAANTASGLAAVIPGGYYNQATGESSFAAGRLARAFHDRTFVWSDGQNGEFISTAVNQFLIHAAGGVGIGTSNPQAALDVAGKVKCQVLELAGADLAEKFDITGEATPGMVVCPDPENDGKLRLSAREYDRSAIGVVSGAGGIRTGLLLHQPGSAAEGDLAVAMTGRVYVQADASFGAIKPGDELTSSANPGHAMKVTDDARANRAVLGTALSTLKSGKGLVLVALQRR